MKKITISEKGKKYLESLLAEGAEWLGRNPEEYPGSRKELGIFGVYKPKKFNSYGWNGLHSTGEFYVPVEFDEFDFITDDQWEPWSIQEILENCEVCA